MDGETRQTGFDRTGGTGKVSQVRKASSSSSSFVFEGGIYLV